MKKTVVAILTAEAKLALARHRPKIVAITGNVGKTSTKDAIAAALSNHHRVRKSQKSFNSEIGVPLTILGLDNAWGSAFGWISNIAVGFYRALSGAYPEWLVLEVGADHPGDIRRTAYWLAPDVAVLTRFPDVPVHVEFFDSPEAVSEEKRHLAKALREGGILIVNADDPKTNALAASGSQRRLSYGSAAHADVRLMEAAIEYRDGRPFGMLLRVTCKGDSVAVRLPGSIGAGRTGSALAAVAVAHALGENLAEAAEALGADAPAPGRMRLLEGANGSTIIDDTYNASPAAAEAALAALASIETPGRRFFALADMKELGDYADDAHRAVGKRVAALFAEGKVQHFLAVGEKMALAAAAATAAGMPQSAIALYPDAGALGHALRAMLGSADVALLKGSQSMRMERAVAAALRNPDDAARLLVRQEVQWQHR